MASALPEPPITVRTGGFWPFGKKKVRALFDGREIDGTFDLRIRSEHGPSYERLDQIFLRRDFFIARPKVTVVFDPPLWADIELRGAEGYGEMEISTRALYHPETHGRKPTTHLWGGRYRSIQIGSREDELWEDMIDNGVHLHIRARGVQIVESHTDDDVWDRHIRSPDEPGPDFSRWAARQIPDSL